ncbi:MAG: helix-turn-helix transcriptional regulator [Oscillospiraceae bacterium]|nr:helix-turn-helix transcriptional regulator [Oscillospiraceae bacterium]
MRKNFLIEGNICGDRVRVARVCRKMEQKDLARELNLLGMGMTPLIVSRIENNQRHVCDAELMMLAKVLKVSMEWLCGEGEGLPK